MPTAILEPAGRFGHIEKVSLMAAECDGPMTPAMLTAAGEVIFGKRWRLPLARALGCNASLIHQFLIGRCHISPELARVVRKLAYLSPTAGIILDKIKVMIPEVEHRQAFRLAKLTAQNLSDAGLLVGREEVPAVIDGHVGWRKREHQHNSPG